MADVIQKIDGGEDVNNGKITVNTGSPVPTSVAPPNPPVAQPNLTTIEAILTPRFDDPSYYFGTP